MEYISSNSSIIYIIVIVIVSSNSNSNSNSNLIINSNITSSICNIIIFVVFIIINFINSINYLSKMDYGFMDLLDKITNQSSNVDNDGSNKQVTPSPALSSQVSFSSSVVNSNITKLDIVNSDTPTPVPILTTTPTILPSLANVVSPKERLDQLLSQIANKDNNDANFNQVPDYLQAMLLFVFVKIESTTDSNGAGIFTVLYITITSYSFIYYTNIISIT